MHSGEDEYAGVVVGSVVVFFDFDFVGLACFYHVPDVVFVWAFVEEPDFVFWY